MEIYREIAKKYAGLEKNIECLKQMRTDTPVRLEKSYQENRQSRIIELKRIISEYVTPENENYLNIDWDLAINGYVKYQKNTIKVFKFFSEKLGLSESNKEKLRLELCDFYSVKTSGKIIVTNDPVEVLFSSANTTDWESCHSPDGERFAGAYVYAMYPNVFVAYQSNNDSYKKLWRQMIYVIPDSLGNNCIVCSRHYPNYNENCELIARNMLFEYLGEKYSITKMSNSEIQDLVKVIMIETYDGDIPYVDAVLYYGQYTICVPTRALNGKSVKEYLERITPVLNFNSKKIKAYCLDCGCEINKFVTGKIICESCIGVICSNCGAECGNNFYTVDDTVYCEECFYDHYNYCCNCGAQLAIDDLIISGCDNRYYCDYCYNKIFTRCSNCEKEIFMTNAYSDEDNVYCKECYEKNVKEVVG